MTEITLNDGTTWTPAPILLANWKKAYPALNIERELQAASVWCDSNPKNRKTQAGITRFVNAWLARAQDKGGSSRAEPEPVRHFDGMSPEECRECAIGDRVIEAVLNETEFPETTTRFNLRRLAEKIVADQRANSTDWPDAKAFASACYGTMHAAIRKAWR